LYLRDSELFYTLLLIEKGDDESLYVKFPRQRGYRIKDSHESVDVPSKIAFQEKFQGTIFHDPYLSYHAVSGKTHANAFIRQDKSGKPKKVSFFTDTSSTKAQFLLRRYEFDPFVSVILPLNVDIYDCIGKRPAPFLYNYFEISDHPLFLKQDNLKAPTFVALDKAKVGSAGYINLEIFFHRKDVETIRPFLQDLDKRNIIEVVKLDSTLANLSYSLVLSALPKQHNEDPSLDVVAFLFNKDKFQGFALT
jgi:hypothetical protein